MLQKEKMGNDPSTSPRAQDASTSHGGEYASAAKYKVARIVAVQRINNTFSCTLDVKRYISSQMGLISRGYS
jgi:hypothetical protein